MKKVYVGFLKINNYLLLQRFKYLLKLKKKSTKVSVLRFHVNSYSRAVIDPREIC